MKKINLTAQSPQLSGGFAAEDAKLCERGVDYLRATGYLENVRDCRRFYYDRHWEGIATDGVFGKDGPPFINFIKPGVNYKVSAIGQNSVRVVFTPAESVFDAFSPTAERVCEQLTDYCDTAWENLKLETLRWRAIRDAAITGDGLVYFYFDSDKPAAQNLDYSNVFLADENDPELQHQDYIIVTYRRTVASVRAEAIRRGLSQTEAEQILPDGDEGLRGGDSEISTPENGGGKVLVILKLYRENGKIFMRKSASGVPVMQPTDTGLTLYPLAKFSWEEVVNNARANGVVLAQIPNQVEYNKTLARRSLKVMETAYPKMVYNEGYVDNPDELDNVGAKIAVSGGESVRNYIDYLAPAASSPDVGSLSRDLMELTQRAAGTSEAALGNVDPESASGKAIIAVQDAAARVLSLQSRQHTQFVEDIGRILFDFWRAYTPESGKKIVYYDQDSGKRMGALVEKTVLEALDVDVRIEVSPSSPYSLISQEHTLENYMRAGAITFEEMVDALPNNSIAPKIRLKKIIEARAASGALTQGKEENASGAGESRNASAASDIGSARG